MCMQLLQDKNKPGCYSEFEKLFQEQISPIQWEKNDGLFLYILVCQDGELDNQVCAIYADRAHQTEADRRVKGLHCGSLCPVPMQEGCKRYPCLLPPCPTLTLLHPAAKEWGSPGNRTAGEAREGKGVAESGG